MKMNSLKYIALCSVLGFSLTSCEDWLDVNVNPDQPNNESIQLQNRLPWIQRGYTYSAGSANTRTLTTCGGLYSVNANYNGISVTWAGANNVSTTPYQTWFVLTGSNVSDMYKKAEAENAYHYMGAAEVIYALGFMEMLDLYGEIPFTQALGLPNPAYDDGKTIWEGCLARIDHAIELFNMQQPAGATSLASGDLWNGGDVNKWIKLCYGLKARWLLRVSKNTAYFKPDEILACLEKAPTSNNDNIYQACYDEKGDNTDLITGDPFMTNGNWNTAAYGKQQWPTKYFIDMLTNLRDAGVEDPRLDKLVPSSMTNIVLDDNGNVKSYDWRRSEGIDVFGDAKRLVAGGAASILVQTLATSTKGMKYQITKSEDKAEFLNAVKAKGYKQLANDTEWDKTLPGGQYKDSADYVVVFYPKGAWYVNANTYYSAGDTAYVNICSGSQNTNNGTWGMPANDTYYHSNDQAAAKTGAVSGTGTFNAYAVSDFDVLTYHEMCFIKAEILMRKGDKGGALAAYKAGIQAHMDRMQSKLQQWAGNYENPGMQPMDAAAIASYMTSGAVAQSAAELTMSDIMLQKFIAMGISLENWVDMRRFNYSAGNIESFGVVYPKYGRTKLFTGSAACPGGSPTDLTYWIRRWRECVHEVNYNTINLLSMNPHALDNSIWSMPVWWDCASDAEYYSYLK